MPISVTVNQLPLPPNTSDKIQGTLVLRDANGAAALDLKAGTIIEGSSPTPALRVTQTGSGDALVVEDSENPDSTPLVINSIGQIISGATAAFAGNAGIQLASDSNNAPSSNLALRRHQGDSADFNSVVILSRARGTAADPQPVQSGDAIGSVGFQLYNGASFQNAASIDARCDAAPGADGPGRLIFRTTPVGSTTLTERMRIDSAGNVGIGGTADADAILDLQSTSKGFLPPRMTTTQRNAIAAPVPAGLMVYNTTTNKLNFFNGTTWESVTSS